MCNRQKSTCRRSKIMYAKCEQNISVIFEKTESMETICDFTSAYYLTND